MQVQSQAFWVEDGVLGVAQTAKLLGGHFLHPASLLKHPKENKSQPFGAILNHILINLDFSYI